MKRIPEEELMTEPAHAEAYASADFSEPHNAFVTQFREQFPECSGDFRALDLGCGAADISVRFASAYPGCTVDGIEGSAAMLTLGHQLICQAELQHRVQLLDCVLPITDAQPIYDVIISNSLLHHLADPLVLWRTIKQFGKSGSVIFVMDLLRPHDRHRAEELVLMYAEDEHPLLKQDFLNSLCAAYRVEEVRQQLDDEGLAVLSVDAVSDRHLVVSGILP